MNEDKQLVSVNQKKVGIVTLFGRIGGNYGAFLQAYALQEQIALLNYDVNIIHYFNPNWRSLNYKSQIGLRAKLKFLYNVLKNHRRYWMAQQKMKRYLDCVQCELNLSHKELCDVNQLRVLGDDYDCFISGSDQVWNYTHTEGNLTYFLNFVSDSKKKLSYAASFGKETFSIDEIKAMGNYLAEYKIRLVREDSGRKLLKDKFGLDAQVVLDPTFLMRKEEWLALGNKSTMCNSTKRTKYILIYIAQPTTHLWQVAAKYAEKYQLKIILLGYRKKRKGDKVSYHMISNANPYDFISLISGAEAVFTTSFHGLAFSINLSKTFYYELSKKQINNNSRLIDIAHLLNVESQEIKSEVLIESTIDWELVHTKLEKERLRSLSLLKEMLKGVDARS